MAESIDFRLEQSIPELQDLVHKELFTQEEVKSIIKKRTQHEHTLLRPSAKKADYLRYIAYEHSLEKLRQKRLKRKRQKSKKSVSDYAGQRRIRNLFERACLRFQDLRLWMQYIEYVKEQGSHKITNKVFGEALQKFPSSAELWILAAQYEYHTNFNISAARNLMLRSLRLNPEKRELWWEYANLECLYILKIIQRRRILGLDEHRTQPQIDDGSADFEDKDEIVLPSITAEELEKEDNVKMDPLLTSPLTNVATNPALNGAIPLAIFNSAVDTRRDDGTLAAGFYDVFLSFLSELGFMNSLLDTVKEHLEGKFPGRGKTVLIQMRDCARGIDVTDKAFIGVVREMMKFEGKVKELLSKERKECCVGLSEYLRKVMAVEELDENLKIALHLFQQRVDSWST